MNTVSTFDTHRYIKHLTERGFTEQQAEALADEQMLLLSENLASKDNLARVDADLKAEIARVEANLKTEIAKVNSDLRAEIAKVDANLRAEIAKVDAKITQVEANLKAELAKMDVKITQSKDELIKWIAGFGFGVVAALAALMVGVLS